MLCKFSGKTNYAYIFNLDSGTAGTNQNKQKESLVGPCTVEEEIVHNSKKAISSLDTLEQEIRVLDIME